VVRLTLRCSLFCDRKPPRCRAAVGLQQIPSRCRRPIGCGWATTTSSRYCPRSRAAARRSNDSGGRASCDPTSAVSVHLDTYCLTGREYAAATPRLSGAEAASAPHPRKPRVRTATINSISNPPAAAKPPAPCITRAPSTRRRRRRSAGRDSRPGLDLQDHLDQGRVCSQAWV